MANRMGAEFRMLPLDDNGEVRLDALDEVAAGGNVKIVASNLVSNSLGTISDVATLAAWAHEQGAIYVVRRRAGRAAPAGGRPGARRRLRRRLRPQDVRPERDRLPVGTAELLERMEPFLMGGHMIRKVAVRADDLGRAAAQVRGGSAPSAEAVGLGAAIDYLEAIGLDAIAAYEHELAAYALERLAEVPAIVLYGPPADHRAGIVSFNVGEFHPHDVAQILDMDAIAIRAGHHCCQPLMRKLGVAATNRASFYLYTIPEEIDRLVDGLHKVHKILG